jgi:hypothetical protein
MTVLWGQSPVLDTPGSVQNPKSDKAIPRRESNIADVIRKIKPRPSSPTDDPIAAGRPVGSTAAGLCVMAVTIRHSHTFPSKSYSPQGSVASVPRRESGLCYCPNATRSHPTRHSVVGSRISSPLRVPLCVIPGHLKINQIAAGDAPVSPPRHRRLAKAESSCDGHFMGRLLVGITLAIGRRTTHPYRLGAIVNISESILRILRVCPAAGAAGAACSELVAGAGRTNPPSCCHIHGRPKPDTTNCSKCPFSAVFLVEVRLPYRIEKRSASEKEKTECLPSSTFWKLADWR